MPHASRPACTAPTDAPQLTRRAVLALLASAAAGALVPGCASKRIGDTAARASTQPSKEAFLTAVQRGDDAAVEAMLDRDASLARAADSAGRSAFVLAYLSGHPPIGALLRQRGLELDVVEAVLAEDWSRVESLAAAQPESMNAAHPIGGNPLYASGLTGGAEQYRLRALGCDPNGRPSGGSGLTPDRAAMDCRDPLGAWLAGTDILGNGGDVNASQARGDSVLHGAVRARDTRLVRLAIRKGADLAARDEAGRTPRALAEELEWRAGVELLAAEATIPRDHRASQFAFNASREPFTLLPIDDIAPEVQSEITGVSHFDRERVQALLAAEPRLIHAISTDDELAIEACGHTGQRQIIQLHLDHGAPLSLPTAISLGNLEHARWLLEKDPLLIHERGPHDFPVMWYPAIGGGSVEAAEMLLAHGADIEQESGGETALHWAALRGHADLVRALVGRGADMAAVGYRQERAGRTPLQLAADKGHDGVVQVLRELGSPA
ncbi:MAG: ankyrin repeat domain-containing protein [Planctomycetota bacterium]